MKKSCWTWNTFLLKFFLDQNFEFLFLFYGLTVSPIKCQHNKVTYILFIKKMSKLCCLQKVSISKIKQNFTWVDWLLFLHPIRLIREKTMSNCYIDQGWEESQNVNFEKVLSVHFWLSVLVLALKWTNLDFMATLIAQLSWDMIKRSLPFSIDFTNFLFAINGY